MMPKSYALTKAKVAPRLWGQFEQEPGPSPACCPRAAMLTEPSRAYARDGMNGFMAGAPPGRARCAGFGPPMARGYRTGGRSARTSSRAGLPAMPAVRGRTKPKLPRRKSRGEKVFGPLLDRHGGRRPAPAQRAASAQRGFQQPPSPANGSGAAATESRDFRQQVVAPQRPSRRGGGGNGNRHGRAGIELIPAGQLHSLKQIVEMAGARPGHFAYRDTRDIAGRRRQMTRSRLLPPAATAACWSNCSSRRFRPCRQSPDRPNSTASVSQRLACVTSPLDAPRPWRT